MEVARNDCDHAVYISTGPIGCDCDKAACDKWPIVYRPPNLYLHDQLDYRPFVQDAYVCLLFNAQAMVRGATKGFYPASMVKNLVR